MANHWMSEYSLQSSMDSVRNAPHKNDRHMMDYDTRHDVSNDSYKKKCNAYVTNQTWTSQTDPIEDKHTGNREDIESGCSSCLTKYTQETSFSGLKYVGGNGNSFRRFFWLIVVLLAFAGLAYQILISTQKFVLRPTNTKLSYIEKDELDFPSVTFCNANMFRLDKLLNGYGGWFPLIDVGLNQIRKLFPKLGLSNIDGNVVLPEEYPGHLSLYRFILDNAHTKEDTIKLCRFDGKECGPENFTTIVTNYGVCFTFNSISQGQTLTVKTPGQLRGLSVILNSDQQLYVAAPRENAGFKVLIHPRDEMPNLEDYGVELGVGTHTAMRLGIRKMELLPKPYGTCVPKGTRQLKYIDGNYTESKCFTECKTDFIVRACRCRTFYMPGDSPYCSPRDLTECFHEKSDHFNEKKSDLCKHCENSCEETIYQLLVSQSTFPSYSVANSFAVNGDITYRSIAFAEVVALSATHILGEMNLWLGVNVNHWYPGLTNNDGKTLGTTFPHAIDAIVGNMSETFQSLQYDLYFHLSEGIYEEVANWWIYNASYGSKKYYEVADIYANSYIKSGTFKSSFAKGLEDAYHSGTQNVTFDEFVDATYGEFSIENDFHLKFHRIYSDIHDLLITYGQEIYANSNLEGLTTKYLRDNLVHADIFYGDLKVEKITEQADYEFFQFVCDLGGALGLFFGASLLSFIETMDFFAVAGFKAKNDT